MPSVLLIGVESPSVWNAGSWLLIDESGASSRHTTITEADYETPMHPLKPEILNEISSMEKVLDDAIDNLDSRIGDDVIKNLDARIHRLSRLSRRHSRASGQLISRLDEAQAVLRYVNHAEGVGVEGVLLGILVASGAVDHLVEEIVFDNHD